MRLSRLTNVNGYGGTFAFFFQNAANSEVDYARFGAFIENNNTGSHGGGLAFYTTGAGITNQERLRISALGLIGINTTNPNFILDVNSTDAIRFPSGTTAQRPTLATGLFRYNTTWGGFDIGKADWRRVIDLPDATPTTGDVPSYSGSAWATNAQRAGRVTGATTNSGGYITVTLGTAMPDDTYAVTASCTATTGYYATVTATTTTTFTVRIFEPGGAEANSTGGISFNYIAINY